MTAVTLIIPLVGGRPGSQIKLCTVDDKTFNVYFRVIKVTESKFRQMSLTGESAGGVLRNL